MGKCYEQLGNRKEARKWLQKAADYESGNADWMKVGDMSTVLAPPSFLVYRPRGKLRSCLLVCGGDSKH